jgi:MFS family permease
VTAVALRRNRDFVALWVGQAVSNLGISISSFAYPLVVLVGTGSATKAGLVGSVLTGTTFFLRLPAGALVDRWDRRRIMLACDAGRALASASLAVALALGHFYLSHVLAVAVVEGSLGVLFGPAESAAVRRVVEPEQRREAVARNQSRAQIPGVLGPPLGGVLLAGGRSLPFVADAISYLVSFAAVASVRTPLHEQANERRGRQLSEMFEGIRWLWARPFLRSLLVWEALGMVVYGSLGLVILVLARDRGASPPELGAMFAIMSAGAVAGAFSTPWLLRALPARVLVLLSAWVSPALILVLLVAHSPYLIGLLGAVSLFLTPAVGALLFASISANAPDELQGRTIGGAIQITNLASPVAPVLGGVLIGALGTSRTLLVDAAFLFCLALGASLSRGLRQAD